jgi:uncharacterized protein YqgV (UPF0045/DUF77 family)
MKEKIFASLKAAILVNGKTSVSDKTLNGYVDLISGQITDESQIKEAIKPYVTVIQGALDDVNAAAATAVKAEKDARAVLEKEIKELKESHLTPGPSPGRGEKDTGEGVLTAEDVKKLIEEATKSDREKIASFEAMTKQTARQSEIAAKVKELGLTDADMKFVSVPEDKDVTSYLTDYRQNLIDRGLKPLGAGGAAPVDEKASAETAKGWLESISVKS